MSFTSFDGKSLSGLGNRLFQHLPERTRHRILQANKQAAFNEPGTLNNQERREEAALYILNTFHPAAIMETGTYLGAGTKFFLAHTEGCPIATCETQDFHHAFSTERFKDEPRVSVYKGSSVDFLTQFPASRFPADQNTFLYLDAHWEKCLPLKEEVSLILKRWPKALIMVDDFAVPHDRGYGYDNYGKAGVLNADYLRGINDDLAIFYPASESSKETGARRGTCFLCLPETEAYSLLSGNSDFFTAGGRLAQKSAIQAILSAAGVISKSGNGRQSGR